MDVIASNSFPMTAGNLSTMTQRVIRSEAKHSVFCRGLLDFYWIDVYFYFYVLNIFESFYENFCC
jgi:hypothetical protein